MRLSVQGQDCFISTGGRPFDPDGKVLLFIHGSGQSHLSWLLQARFFANRGYAVLAPDLPGHGLSAGHAMPSIEDAADWCAELLTAAGVETAVVIGHSQGGLVGLEMARRHPGRTRSLALIGSALAIPVADFLLKLADSDEARASAMMVSFSHGQIGHRHDHTMPGQSHLYYGEQVMAQNSKGVLLTDLHACNNYQTGADAAAAITCPVLCVIAGRDRMVPTKTGLAMAEAIPHSHHTVIANAGHFVQSERSVETNAALRPFFLDSF